MTCLSHAPEGHVPSNKPGHSLTTLVRLLAREAARADAASHCNPDHGEA